MNRKIMKGFKRRGRGFALLKKALAGMTVEQRLLFMVRYAHAHKRALDKKKRGE